MGLTGGNMEGKEVRFGIVASALFAVITTAASCGAVNAMHDSFDGARRHDPLINMQLGEIIIGGVGAGMYGMLLFVIVSVFVAGLMVGRSRVRRQEDRGQGGQDGHARHPDPAADVSGLDGRRRGGPAAVASMANPGPHGFTEVSLRLHLADRQQRLGLRGPHRQHALLQRHRCRSRCSSAASG
jgi:K+-transporting ATPase ATPase A chain